jgi:CRP-like cAMP-binding protein
MDRQARFIGPVERLLYLRSMGNLDDMPAEEAADLAQRVRERSFRSGSLLLREGEVVTSAFFLVEGVVALRRGGRTYRVIQAPGTVGMLAALSASPRGVEARAETDCLTLELAGDEFVDTLEDNFRLLSRMIAQFSGQIAALQRKLEARGLSIREEPKITPYPERELDLVRRLVWLRRGGPFRSVSLDAMAEIARRLIEVRCEPGDVLWKQGERSEFGLQILHGIVVCTDDSAQRSFRMGGGSVLGMLEAYAHLPRGYDAVAETRLVALRADVEALLDVFEDNFEVGLAFVSFLAGVLDNLYERAAELGVELEA